MNTRLQVNRAALVAAHRAKDWTTAAALSCEKESLKVERRRHCRVCERAISRCQPSKTGLCLTCLNFEKYHSRKLK